MNLGKLWIYNIHEFEFNIIDSMSLRRFSATEMWDEWDEDPDDFFNYKHQRRLSDPCSNINNFSRFAFRSRGGGMNDTAQSKARSENEGLDALGNEISEIEAGDLRDGE